MPKDKRSPSCGCGVSPYSRRYTNADKRTSKSPSRPIGNENECEEARCPICMDHPHNAVLLLCSSHEKGCRPYMCDTSSRHSNCLDQFRKSAMKKRGEQAKLICPLCRGQISGWTVVNPAREFMNSKTRNCSLGTCDFTGNYSQLREHARRVHPHVRPTDVDPERELEWRTLEDDMWQQDMMSMQFTLDDFLNIDNSLETDYENPFPEWESGLYDDLDNNSLETDYENSFSELESYDSDNNSLETDYENPFPELTPAAIEAETRDSGMALIPLGDSRRGSARQNARNRTATQVRQRSNSQPGSHNYINFNQTSLGV